MERKQHKRPTTIMQEHPEFTRTSAVYVSTHQEEMKGLLDSLSTQEVRESCRNKASLRDTMCMQSRTGVIYASARAKEFGWTGPDDPLWGNLGQGAPETQPLPNQPERNLHVDLTDETNEYSSVNGRSDLREAVANYYNKFFRSGKESQYSPENVAIVAGGRAGLSRLMCTLHNCNVGYSLPDYTAYSQLLGEFNGISPIVVEQDEENCTATSAESLRRQVRLHGLGGFLFSNPGNPTGTIVRGQKLSEYCAIARDENCLMLMDEFYSHYCYDEDSDEGRASVEARGFNAFSSAEFVDDVDEDPVVIINGLTKNWRLPGWRVCWVVGPRHAIDVLASVGSFMDGGANQPLQAAAPSLLNIDFVRDDAIALQAHFRAKRDYLVDNLRRLGIVVESPDATFYLWANVGSLPPPLNNGVIFFEHCIRHKVICCPGIFFDVNPYHRRKYTRSPFVNFVRLSFGPKWQNLHLAMAAIERMVNSARKGKIGPLTEPAA
ncbi:hypothetical protein ScalyP_jg8279 [Parmales sp. scaly parma]|nr:hypothetical protein ScalyP_jg8279 [Parmales sp. scaly parma]